MLATGTLSPGLTLSRSLSVLLSLSCLPSFSLSLFPSLSLSYSLSLPLSPSLSLCLSLPLSLSPSLSGKMLLSRAKGGAWKFQVKRARAVKVHAYLIHCIAEHCVHLFDFCVSNFEPLRF